MWFRRDLRLHDLPALAAAAHADRVVPLFVLDDRLLARGRFPSAVRTAFMLGCLRELDAALKERGARLFVRRGRPEDELPRLAREVGATSVHLTGDVSPWARARDARVTEALRGLGVDVHAAPGGAVVDDPAAIRTRQDRPYTVFSPFARAWLRAGRRARSAPRPSCARRRARPRATCPGSRSSAWTPPTPSPTPSPSPARPPGAGGSRASCAPTWRRTPTGATGRRAARRACPPTCAGAASPRSSSTAASPSRRAPARGTTAPSWPGATSTRRCSCTSRT